MIHKIENGSELSSIVCWLKENEQILTVFLFLAEQRLNRKKAKGKDKKYINKQSMHEKGEEMVFSSRTLQVMN